MVLWECFAIAAPIPDILFKVLGRVVDLPVGSDPLCSRGTGDRGGAGRDGLERLVVDS